MRRGGFTLLSILLVPIAFTLVLGGVMQGISVAAITGSSRLSIVLYFLVVTPEWLTYVIATTAGANIGLSVMMPERQAVASHWHAFTLAWAEALYLYAVVAPILAVQAFAEVLYVRKVLLSGGSGIPLQPY